MSMDIVKLVARIEREMGTEVAYTLSVALHAADTLRVEQPDRFKRSWGEMGFDAIAELFYDKEQANPSMPELLAWNKQGGQIE